jgi:aerobic-type carbon monoxide dehydrogenase small subunit (CoxS/CutS family)
VRVVHVTVNAQRYDIAPPAQETLLETLRERLGLTGAKLGCDRGECGACTVLLDGQPAYACLTLTVACEDRAITTVEGLAIGGALHPLQEAFIAHDGLQCGFCTAGQLLAASALLEVNPDPTEEEVVRWMSGNLCRCGAYAKIARAVLDAARRRPADATA